MQKWGVYRLELVKTSVRRIIGTMKIGILGTRGIPNNYGGFEQFAEHLSVGLVQRGHEVWVYNSHNHPCQENMWQGVNLIKCHDPEDCIGIPGQFIYDYHCIVDARSRHFDILLQLGYTSNSIWHKLLPRTAKIITNMDGLEWQRSKYSKPVKRFLKFAEKLAVKSSDLLIADSEVILDYLSKTYHMESTYIPYGAEIFETPDERKITSFNINPGEFFLLMARMQPDNHIEEIIQGFLQSGTAYPLLVIGPTLNRHGKYLEKTYKSERIRFLGPLFDKEKLNNLRYFSGIYFHGHSSGGTNPSLLEAMAASAPICAHDNPFNREVLGSDALYFSDSNRIAEIIGNHGPPNRNSAFILNNIDRIKKKFAWNQVIAAYEKAFKDWVS